MKNNTTTGNKADDISLKEIIQNINSLFRHLLSKWKVIMAAGILGAVLGLTYSFIRKPIYKAELSFALEDDKSGGGSFGAAAGLASQFGFDLGGGGGGAFAGDNLLELMKSRRIVESALLSSVIIEKKEITLAELYISINELRDKWENKPLLKNIHFLPNADVSKFTLQQDSVLGVFYKDIKNGILSVTKADKKLDIIIVRVNSKNEFFSKFFAEIVVKTVSDFYIDSKTKKSVKNVNILKHQADSVRAELDAAQKGVARSIDANPNANPLLQVLRVPSQNRQVDVQANTVILSELVKNLEISKIALRKETPLIQIIDSPVLPLEKDRVGKGVGIVLGGLIAGILAIAIISLKVIYKYILTSEQ